MKKVSLVLAMLTVILFSSCADKKTIDGVTYRPYGIFNEGQYKKDSINYEISGWAVFSGIVFSEFCFIPTVYTFGYHLYEPVSAKGKEDYKTKGVVN